MQRKQTMKREGEENDRRDDVVTSNANEGELSVTQNANDAAAQVSI
tara:strand:- start:558 stop:695 length:138 start_codon:yes stop_codon:yes gene_type:complete